MRIAICDPDLIAAQKMKAAIYAYAESRHLDLVVELFSCGEALLNSEVRYRLILIAYDQNGLSWLETAKQIKKLFFYSAIIFLGNTPDSVLQSIEIAPLRILLKPVDLNALYAALDGYFTGPAVSRPLWIKNGSDTFCCTIGEIHYIEANNKHCLVSLRNKKVPCRKTMAHLFNALPKNHFLRISKGYIVNLIYIESYNKKTVRLTNGEALPITKKYYHSFRAAFSAFCDPIEV